MGNMLQCVISGGQTGADRAALDWAIKKNIQHGGWCPRGRLAEDGEIPLFYNLSETPTENYAERTEWNIRDSDATAIFSNVEVLTGGTALTIKLAIKYQKPYIHIHAGLGIDGSVRHIREFLQVHSIQRLNIAGPRATEDPCVGVFVTRVLDAVFN